MTTSTATNPDPTIEIYLHIAGREDPQLVEVASDGSVADLLALADAVDADAKLRLQDTTDALDMESSLAEAGIGHRCHVHLGSCDSVKVQVRYHTKPIVREFSPGARIRAVFAWAAGPKGFELAETQIPKHGLMVPRSDHILDPDVHVGSLASDARCAVVLDLVPKERFEG